MADTNYQMLSNLSHFFFFFYSFKQNQQSVIKKKKGSSRYFKLAGFFFGLIGFK